MVKIPLEGGRGVHHNAVGNKGWRPPSWAARNDSGGIAKKLPICKNADTEASGTRIQKVGRSERQ